VRALKGSSDMSAISDIEPFQRLEELFKRAHFLETQKAILFAAFSSLLTAKRLAKLLKVLL
jgi:hypothetical protein